MGVEEITVEGALNFRAVADYPARGGRVKARTIYRSGAFADVGEAGARAMWRLNVRTAFDLRSNAEKERSPSPLLSMAGFKVVSEAHTIRHGDLYAVLANPGSTAKACADVMTAIYTTLPIEFAPIFRRYFRTMVESETPVVVHCAAGKDRTGVVVAMLLELLGVARDDIMEDYLATNATRDALYRRLLRNSHGVDYGTVAEHLIEPMITANAPYLDAMFATIARNYGEMDAYAKQVLQLSADDIGTLRRRLVG
jgi:protein-tyrosine phosphatase